MSYPSCASLGDNIFFFGACAHSGTTSPSSIGAFYDKKNGCWQEIPMSGLDDHRMSIDRPVSSDPKHNRLLVYIDILRSLYAYYPDNQQWVCIDDKWLSWPGEPVSSPVDDILYFMSDCSITAYDILTKEFLEFSWSSCSPFGPDILDQSPQMLYLGGNILCFTNTQFGDRGSSRSSFWEYYRFQVGRFSQKKVLLTPLSVHRLPVPAKGHETQLNTIVL